jgi:hypothetical protein
MQRIMKLVAVHLLPPFCYVPSLKFKYSDRHSFVSLSVYYLPVARSCNTAKLTFYTNITVFWDAKQTDWCTGPVAVCEVADYPACGAVTYKLLHKAGILISTVVITSSLLQLRTFSFLICIFT